MRAAELLLRRCRSERKGRPITLAPPPVHDTAGVLDTMAAIVATVACGEITADKA